MPKYLNHRRVKRRGPCLLAVAYSLVYYSLLFGTANFYYTVDEKLEDISSGVHVWYQNTSQAECPQQWDREWMSNYERPFNIKRFIVLQKEITAWQKVYLVSTSILGITATVILFVGIYMDAKALMLLWILLIVNETYTQIINLPFYIYVLTHKKSTVSYLLYFVLDMLLIAANVYAASSVVLEFSDFFITCFVVPIIQTTKLGYSLAGLRPPAVPSRRDNIQMGPIGKQRRPILVRKDAIRRKQRVQHGQMRGGATVF